MNIIVLDKVRPSPTILNKALYVKSIDLLGVRLPCKNVNLLKTHMPKDGLLNIPRVKSIIPDPQKDSGVCCFLLSLQFKNVEDIPCSIMTCLQKHGMLKIINHKLTLDYDYWTVEDILQATLPDHLVVPTGFEIVGHIAHLNLSKEHQPFTHLIGQVILDKNKVLRTVVAKNGIIDSVFRFFQMDLLAGVPDYLVSVRQSDCCFRFDYSKVYWNSRLQHEHDRIVSKFIKKGDVVFDVFAGVGPFAIPAAKKGAVVHANDLNPEAFLFCQDNAAKNKAVVTCYNMDGRDFIKQCAEEIKAQDTCHFIMNLPALAPDFCDAFGGLEEGHLPNIFIHCYMFRRPGECPRDKICNPANLTMDMVDEHYVRSVAPNKDMYCLSFKFSKCINKKQKMSE